MNSLLILAPTLPLDEGGNLLSGFVRIDDDGELPALLHCTPTAPLPEDAVVLRDGRVQSWAWADLAATHPEQAERALRATWQGPPDEDGNPTIVRGSMKRARELGITDLITTNEPPHAWAGEG